MQIANYGAIARESARVTSSVGNFSVEDAQAQMSVDVGGMVYKAWHFVNPAYTLALEAQGDLSYPLRRVLLNDLLRLENIYEPLLQLSEQWSKMAGTAPVIQILPQSHLEIIHERGSHCDDQAMSGSRRIVPALAFFSQKQVSCPTALNEIYYTARALIARFSYDVADVQTLDLMGNPITIPGPEGAAAGDMATLLNSLASKIRAKMRGERLSERAFSKEAELLGAITRVHFYGDLYRRTNIDQVTEATRRLMFMKLYVEAITQLSRAMDDSYVFQRTDLHSIRNLTLLRQNFMAAEVVDKWLGQFFSHMPYVDWMRTESAVTGKWTISASPSMQRILYARTGERGSGVNASPEVPMLDLGGFDAELYLPVGLGDRTNPGTYRTTRDPRSTILVSDMPTLFPRSEDEIGGGNQRFFSVLAHKIVDGLNPRSYQLGEGDGVCPITPFNITLDGDRYRFVLYPISASVTKLGGTLQGYGLQRGFSVQLKTGEQTGVMAKDAAYAADSPLAQDLSWSPPVEMFQTPITTWTVM